MQKKTFLSLILIFISSYLFAGEISNNIKVIDGDTIRIGKEKIRFSGIDAPESNYYNKKQLCYLGEIEIYCGNLSKIFLVEKIENNPITCKREKEKDKYNRTLAECFVKNESLSKLLVRNGYAFAYKKYSKKYVKDEEFAKANNLGLWTMKFEYPWVWRKNNK